MESRTVIELCDGKPKVDIKFLSKLLEDNCEKEVVIYCVTGTTQILRLANQVLNYLASGLQEEELFQHKPKRSFSSERSMFEEKKLLEVWPEAFDVQIEDKSYRILIARAAPFFAENADSETYKWVFAFCSVISSRLLITGADDFSRLDIENLSKLLLSGDSVRKNMRDDSAVDLSMTIFGWNHLLEFELGNLSDGSPNFLLEYINGQTIIDSTTSCNISLVPERNHPDYNTYILELLRSLFSKFTLSGTKSLYKRYVSKNNMNQDWNDFIVRLVCVCPLLGVCENINASNYKLEAAMLDDFKEKLIMDYQKSVSVIVECEDDDNDSQLRIKLETLKIEFLEYFRTCSDGSNVKLCQEFLQDFEMYINSYNGLLLCYNLDSMKLMTPCVD